MVTSCYSTPDPVIAWMSDRLRAGKPSRYVTSHTGQLSLAISLRVGAMSTSLGWEDNRRSGVALAKTIVVYHLRAQRSMSTSSTLLFGYSFTIVYEQRKQTKKTNYTVVQKTLPFLILLQFFFFKRWPIVIIFCVYYIKLICNTSLIGLPVRLFVFFNINRKITKKDNRCHHV